MGIISGDWVVPVVTFRRGATTYTDGSMGQRSSRGMMAAVIDADHVARQFSLMTGGTAGELTEFTVRLRLEQSGFEETLVERRYLVNHGSGHRLAWLNRFGALDYHTFPVAGEWRSGGSRTRIETPPGYRTVATDARGSVKLLSGPCDTRTAEWLSEIFSSPAVWLVEGTEYERVEVAAGEVVSSPLKPSIVQVVVSPAAVNVSRKL